ncbi:OmpA family protein [Maribacter sp. 2210JD10-5]|uniref:OmpA family protein n=1 Tax=Maribacter sp. 2210JD10-5 TaxID=3386272 RepID=UPI0039BCDC4E
MKSIITTCLLFFFFGTVAQGFQEDLVSENASGQQTVATDQTDPESTSGNNTSFSETAKAYKVPHRTFENLNDVTNGFYVISGVFSKSKNLKKQVRKLKRKGFESGYFFNAESNLYYLYVSRYDSWKIALEDCKSNFDNRFKDDVWLLNVTNSKPIENVVPLEEVTYDMLSEAKSDTSEEPFDLQYVEQIKRDSTKISASESKLLKRADEYFDKMWYAEAAKFYELALAKNPEHYSYIVLQKAGDAHYFNTNMQEAYKWYNILYEKRGQEMSSDNVFKYAHSLKGTGNYARSKRLMRLYNKKLKEESAAQASKSLTYSRKEIVLDKILGGKDNFEIKNINLNSPYSDFSPMFYNGDEVVYASSKDSSVFNTRRYKWNDQPYLDLYVAKLNEESMELKNAVKFSKKINTKYHEASVTFSPDGETVYFTRNNYGKKLKRDKKGINHLKIYRSRKIDGEWTEATEVSFNSDFYSTGHPALSKDGKQLYFVSDMPGSIGQTDIFVVDVLENGEFSSPRNLGPEVNTEQKEMFPFINEKKLYFSSNGHMGMGGLDVYEATYDEKGVFSEVKNLGQPVNSNKDDFSYIVNEETQKGFFASNRKGGKGDDDIYSFKRLTVEETPNNVNAIAGVITELITGDIMPKALIVLLDENNIKLKEVEASDDGSFIFEDLNANTRYTLRTKRDNYIEDERIATTAEGDTISVDVSLRKLNELIQVQDGIRKLKTEMIHFNFDKSSIRKDAAAELDKLIATMNEYPEMVIKIESHTDSRGAAVYNKYLSDKRAKSTRDYIISKGIDSERIQSAIGYGEERLLNECDGSVHCTEPKHYLNRRSEFIIVSM